MQQTFYRMSRYRVGAALSSSGYSDRYERLISLDLVHGSAARHVIDANGAVGGAQIHSPFRVHPLLIRTHNVAVAVGAAAGTGNPVVVGYKRTSAAGSNVGVDETSNAAGSAVVETKRRTDDPEENTDPVEKQNPEEGEGPVWTLMAEKWRLSFFGCLSCRCCRQSVARNSLSLTQPRAVVSYHHYHLHHHPLPVPEFLYLSPLFLKAVIEKTK